ncbi:MAG TPA: O-antigen ligase family protein, partial [Humisphaera sp.]
VGVAAVLVVTTLILTRSRTALTAAAAGTAVTAALAAATARRARRRWFIGMGVALLAGAVLTFGSAAALERWSTLSSAVTYRERVQILSDLRPVWAAFPVLGTGLGTHEYVFPMYDTSARLDVATHAENEFAQVLTETGGVGLTVTLWFIAIVAASVVRAARAGRGRARSMALGVGFAVAATLVHSAADFGQHLPPNALLMAVTCAAGVRLGRIAAAEAEHDGQPVLLAASGPGWWAAARRRLGDAAEAARGRAGSRAARWATVVVSLVIGGAATLSAAEAAEGHRLATQAQDLRDALAARAAPAAELAAADDDNPDYARAIAAAEAACAARPGDVRHRYLLGSVRWDAISRVRDPDTGSIVLTDAQRDHARRIVSDLRAAKPLCPTYGRLHSLAGQIAWLVLGEPAAAAEVRSAARLLPHDPDTAMLAVRVDLGEGRDADLDARLRRCLDLGVSFDGVARLCLTAGRVETAIALAGGSADRMVTLADRLDEVGGHPDVARAIRGRADDQLAAEARSADSPPERLIRAAVRLAELTRHDEAADVFRRATLKDPANVAARLGLAAALAAGGRYDDALLAAKAARMVDPANPVVADRIEEYERKLATTRPTGAGR